VDQLNEFSLAAEDRVALQPQGVRAWIVIDESDHSKLLGRVPEQFAKHERARFAGTVNGQPVPRTTTAGVFTD
jgi:hypothetical protein